MWGTSIVKKLKLYIILLFLLSLLTLILGAYLEETGYLVKWQHGKIIGDIINEIGIALLIVSCISIILEIGEFKRYFNDRIQEIIIDDAYIVFLRQYFRKMLLVCEGEK